MPRGSWTAADERQYKKIVSSCKQRRKCKSAKATRLKHCKSTCKGTSNKKLRAQCTRSCRTVRSCVSNCERLAARIVNARRASRRRSR